VASGISSGSVMIRPMMRWQIASAYGQLNISRALFNSDSSSEASSQAILCLRPVRGSSNTSLKVRSLLKASFARRAHMSMRNAMMPTVNSAVIISLQVISTDSRHMSVFPPLSWCVVEDLQAIFPSICQV
jgi:hypothetical protein